MPVGARAAIAPDGAAAALRALPVWMRVGAIADALALEPGEEPDRPQARLSMPEALMSVWHEPFAWLMVATALADDEIADRAADVAEEARDARSRAQSSAEYAVRSTRLERQLGELRLASTTGLWRVHLLAGGADERSARRIGAMLASSADLTGVPHVLVPTTEPTGSLDDALYQPAWRSGQIHAPFVAPSRMVAALLEPPRREVPGIRLRLRPDFDTTPESHETAAGGGTGPAAELNTVHLGRVLDGNGAPVGALPVPAESLVRHVFVAGATGAGKSQTVRHLLEEASRIDVPWLVIEPSKAEYRAMGARLPGVEVMVVRPGDINTAPAGVNPLEPAPGFPLQTHVDLVRALFNAAFEAEEPFPQVLSAALIRCYEHQGWHLTLGRPQVGARQPRYPTLADLQRAAEEVVSEIGYGREVTDNVRGFIRVRLGSLRLGTTGRFFEGGHPLDFDEVLRNPVVFELEDVGDDQDKAFLMGTLLIRLTEHLRVDSRRAGGGTGRPVLRHLTVIEEAHRLLRHQSGQGPGAHAVEMFASLLAEIRAYGEGIVIAEQIPTKLIPDVIKNTAVKILHRLPALDDRQAVGATMNLTDGQSTYLVTLAPGTAAVFTDGMDYPVLARMPDGTAREMAASTPGSPVRLVGRRSVTCGAECARQPCKLTEIETARQLPDDPALSWWRLWAELCVVAHLTGWTAPRPRANLLATAGALPRRLLECVVGHLADAAVAARSAIITRSASPEALAAHAAQTMCGQLISATLCAPEEPEWLARPFRWCLVWDELKRMVRDRPDAPPHPRTAEWQQRYGHPLPGASAADQLALVQQWYEDDERDTQARQDVFFGTHRPSTIELVLGAGTAADQWPARLERALADFPGTRWAQRYLGARPS
jgi:hypothetical protein